MQAYSNAYLDNLEWYFPSKFTIFLNELKKIIFVLNERSGDISAGLNDTFILGEQKHKQAV